MKFYEYRKSENKKVAKILGFPVLKQTVNFMTSERIQEFLGGLITTKKLYSLENESSNKETQFMGKPIISRFEENNCRIYSFMGKEYRKVSLVEQFKKRYIKYFNKEHDDIYILSANSGEIYLTLTYIIDALIKKNGSKKPLLVATQKYHVDLIKMLCPDLPHIYIKKLRLKIIGESFKVNDFRFFLLFDSNHFKQVEADIKSNDLGKHHYFKSILNRFDLKESDLGIRNITVPADIEQSMIQKVTNIGLNLEKFVFLAPEAQSCMLYDEDFWCSLIREFQQKGYDVFANLVDDEVKLKSASGYKTCYLSFAEAFALAKRAKKIVSLRSGFTEFLTQTGVPISVLYTKFRYRHVFNDMDSYHVMSGFGLVQLPFVDVNKIQEYNMFETSSRECITKILAGF